MGRCDVLDLDEVIARLQSLGDPANVEGMERFGIWARKALGVAAPDLRRLARRIGKDHRLARQLWATWLLGNQKRKSFWNFLI